MADERTKPPYNQPSAVPAKYNPAAVPQKRDCGMSFHEGRLWLQMDVLHWPSLLKKDGDDLFDHYRHMLESLGKDFSSSPRSDSYSKTLSPTPVSRDKASLDSFWLKDESLEASDNLSDPDVIAQEIAEDLEAALEQFREIATDLGERK